jgi:hypothetical protein
LQIIKTIWFLQSYAVKCYVIFDNYTTKIEELSSQAAKIMNFSTANGQIEIIFNNKIIVKGIVLICVLDVKD